MIEVNRTAKRVSAKEPVSEFQKEMQKWFAAILQELKNEKVDLSEPPSLAYAQRWSPYNAGIDDAIKIVQSKARGLGLKA